MKSEAMNRKTSESASSTPAAKLGTLAGWLMSKSNQEKNQWLIDKLDIDPCGNILEVGFGTGDVISRLALQLSSGFIAGIDHSRLMYEIASEKAQVYKKEKVALHQADVWSIPYATAYFDLIYGSNVHFFWKKPVHEYQFLQKFLKPGGRLVMVFQPRWIKSDMELRSEMERIREDFLAAGFHLIHTEIKSMKPVDCIYIEGVRISNIE